MHPGGNGSAGHALQLGSRNAGNTHHQGQERPDASWALPPSRVTAGVALRASASAWPMQRSAQRPAAMCKWPPV